MSEHSAEKAATLRRAAIAMRDQHGPERVRHDVWSALSTTLFMAADHHDDRGNACGSCIDQAYAIAVAYEQNTPPASTPEEVKR